MKTNNNIEYIFLEYIFNVLIKYIINKYRKWSEYN